MQVFLLWGLQKLSIVLFCIVDAFKETCQLVRNIFQLLQLYMVCDVRATRYAFFSLFLIEWRRFGTVTFPYLMNDEIVTSILIIA